MASKTEGKEGGGRGNVNEARTDEVSVFPTSKRDADTEIEPRSVTVSKSTDPCQHTADTKTVIPAR